MQARLIILFLISSLLSQIPYAQQVSEKAMASYLKAKEYGSRTQWEEGITEFKGH